METVRMTVGARKLNAWLEEHDVSTSAFAERVSVNRSQAHRLRTGRRIPRVDLVERIHAETNGAVTSADWAKRVSGSNRRRHVRSMPQASGR